MSAPIERDRRFTFGPEWTGQSRQRWVARFCGEWISQAESREHAVSIAEAWNAVRLAN